MSDAKLADPMEIPTTQFVASLARTIRLTPREAAVLSISGVRNFPSLFNFATAFRSVSDAGVNLAKLSAAAAREMPAMAAALNEEAHRQQHAPHDLQMITSGALHPAGAPMPIGAILQFPVVSQSSQTTYGAGAPGPSGGNGQHFSSPVSNPVVGGAIRVSSGSWPTKDQGNRGTCVAFAVNACGEFVSKASGPLSEQFLYWATKTTTGDPRPDMDGTHLRYAREALDASGVCTERHWPYDGAANPANVTYDSPPNAPSTQARSDAKGRRITMTVPAMVQPGTAAQTLWDALSATKSPVAISLPVIQSPGSSVHNWNSPLATLTGEVADPFVTGQCIGGHAVCVVGFEPDSAEPMGGHFIVRNSWGHRWGTSLPAVGYFGPEPGYGQVSSSYVNDYLWEICHF